MQGSLTGQTAIVTGGSRGYGVGIAEALKRRGANVWITARGEQELRTTAEKLGVSFFVADVAQALDWSALMEKLLAAAGRLDILVNNAGAGIAVKPLDEQTDADIERSIAVNLLGCLYGCRHAAGIMKKQKSGTIINISSVCARQAWPGFSVYSAAKAGMGQAGRCLYTELRPYGVRVTTLIPSWGATSFGEALGHPPQKPERARRCIQPSEIGELVADICCLPPHLALQDLTLWPLIQEVVPL
jgi:NAD(P)-dependent dehydrogenase (short-subunit alcohol dehydrogenase family)